jgi:hypothetical protein
MEAGKFGTAPDFFEALVRFTRINSTEDEVVGGASTLLRHLQFWRRNGSDPSTYVINGVKSVLGNEKVRELFVSRGAVAVSSDVAVFDPVLLKERFIDTLAAVTRDVELTVWKLVDGQPTRVTLVLPSGSQVPVETKVYKLTSWGFESSVATAADEVLVGARAVDSSGLESSLLATTTDLEADPGTLQAVLTGIEQRLPDQFKGRFGLLILSETEEELRSVAYGIIRALEE